MVDGEYHKQVEDLLVWSVSVDALSSVLARVCGALVDVDLAVGAVEAGVAVATEGVGQRDAVAVVAGVAGAPVNFCTLATCLIK